MTTYKELQDEVLAWLDESGDTGTTLTNVKNALNQAHFNRLTKELWPFMLWDSAETFSLTAGVQTYGLHPEFHRPYYFYNQTRREYLREVPARGLAPSGADWNQDRDRATFALWGRSPVLSQPTAATTLRIVSSSASDNTVGKAITIRGVVNGAITTESLTPNGTTPVTGSLSFSKVLGVTKGAAWAGTLTLSTSGGTTLLTLNSDEWGRSYQQLYLLASPSTADVVEYRFYRRPRPLTSDNDLPDIPPPFAKVLVWDALMMLFAYDNQAEAARMQEFSKWQFELDTAMRLAFLESQGVEAEPQYVRVTDGGGDWGPSVWMP